MESGRGGEDGSDHEQRVQRERADVASDSIGKHASERSVIGDGDVAELHGPDHRLQPRVLTDLVLRRGTSAVLEIRYAEIKEESHGVCRPRQIEGGGRGLGYQGTTSEGGRVL